MKTVVQFTVNGEPTEILVDTRDTLLEALRNELSLFGTKEGCGNGNCGACTILVDGVSVNSCLMLAAEAEGHTVTTVEGLAVNGELHPLQRAFVEAGGLQCGFCTPGFLMSARAYLDRNPRPSEADLRLALAGNLCRCTGYDKIIRAILTAAEATPAPA
jgi:carbon-monoxide dehydrogenase small subunit